MMFASDDRLPPADETAEWNLIVAVFNKPELLDEMDAESICRDFSTTANTILFTTISEMWSNNIRPDMGSLASTLRANNKLDPVGGMAAISRLMQASLDIFDWQFSLKTVKDLALSRRLAKAGVAVSQLAYDQTRPIIERLDTAQQLVYDIAQDNTDINHAIPSPEACDVVIDRLYSGRKDNIIGHGFNQLYSITGGIRDGHLHVVIGETSMGKSHFGIAQVVSYAPIVPVLAVTMEMDEDEYMTRILARYSGVDSQKILQNNLTEEELSRVVEATNIVSQLKLHIFSASQPTGEQIRTEIRRCTRHWGERPRLLVIDYLQYMSTSGHRSRVEELGAITKDFKRVAMEFGLCSLLLSQARREIYERHDRRPKKNDSRECGTIENDANLILGLYRDEMARPDADDVELGKIEIGVLKNRGGKVNLTVKMDFDPTTSCFS